MQIKDILAECARLYEEKKQLRHALNALEFGEGGEHRIYWSMTVVSAIRKEGPCAEEDEELPAI